MKKLAVCLLVAGCSSPDGARGAGGTIQFSHGRFGGGTILVGQAFFLSHTTPDDAFPPPGGALDACATPTPTPDALVTFLDVGAEVTLAGDETMLLARDVDGSVIGYGPYARQDPPVSMLGREYDVVFEDETWPAAFTMPPALEVAAPDMTAVVHLAGALDVAWTPAGADAIEIDFGPRVCLARDDGSFTVPADVIALLPTSGTLIVVARNVRSHALAGRRVDLIGRATDVQQYARP